VSTASIGTAAVLWVVVALRVPTLAAGPAQRSLWIALAGVATAFTIDIAHVVTALDDVLGTNVPHLIKHSVVVIAAGAIREAIRALVLVPNQAAEGRTRRILGTGIGVIALAALFVAAPVHAEPLPGLTAAAAGEPVLVAYWTVYLIALAAALVGIVRVTVTAVRTFPAGPLRTGMAWMGVGAVLGLVYCAHKTTFLALAVTGVAEPGIEMMERVQSALLTATVAASVTGLMWPSATRWPGLRHLRAHRTYQRLEPLWRAYVQAEPAIALERYARSLRALGEIELRLYRRVIEIRDGMLAIQPYADDHVRDLAVREAGGAGHHDPHLIGEAAWLETARRAKLRGEPPRNHAATAAIGGGNDLATEVRLLTNTSKNLPIIRAIADKLEGANAAKTSR
jgi:hypothetical protein